MKCPTCKDVTLSISTRQEIEIDYCPECRGVWLDRGELDKLIERSTRASEPPEFKKPDDHYKSNDYYKKEYSYKKKKSFLSEIFD